MKSGAKLSKTEMLGANLWSEMQLSSEAIVIPMYLSDNGIHNVDFLKIDVDGADFEILNSFDKALEKFEILGLGIEINFFGSTCDTDHTFHNVDRFMKEHGFELFGLTINRYSTAALPSRYLWHLPGRSEFGRPLQGDALYVRDLASHDYDEFTAQLPTTKLLNLICIFASFHLPDCAAEVVLRFSDRLRSVCDVDRILNLLAAQAQGPTETPLSYREYIRRFESNDAMFFTKSPPSATVSKPTPAGELAEVRRQLEHARERIVAMESSKFWELRRNWFRFKRFVGLDGAEGRGDMCWLSYRRTGVGFVLWRPKLTKRLHREFEFTPRNPVGGHHRPRHGSGG
jgi:hypothetical protein